MNDASIHATTIIAALLAAPSAAASLETGDFMAPPAAFVQFCADYPDQCVTVGGPGAVEMDARRWRELARVNAVVNAEIAPQADPNGADAWTLGVRTGDCDDYAVEKRRRLIASGWPSASVLLAVARTQNGEGHLVVVVRTTGGEFVLDNLRMDVPGVRAAGFTWASVQSTAHPRLWRAAK